MSDPIDIPATHRPALQRWLADAWITVREWASTARDWLAGLGPARIAALVVGFLVVCAGIAWTALFAGMPALPSREELWTMNRERSVQFVDASGDQLAVRGPDYGRIVHTSELPPYVSQAFIAAEDQRFMKHNGVDMKSIARAAIANVSANRTVQGGSTITQQLVKNVILDNRQTLRRKAQEASLAIQLEAKLSKEEILDLYVNRVYLGSNAYGVEAGAQTYFGKPATDLTLAEAAFLAALPKAPTRLAEHKTDPDTVARHHWVLDQMVVGGFASAADAARAKATPLKFVETSKSQARISGYVTDWAIEEARTLVPDLPTDAVIKLSVDTRLQLAAEKALDATLAQRGLGASQGAIVVMDTTGAVRAMVGGRDYEKSQFNRATQAHRQPGSLFKTFVYAAALEAGMDPSTVRDDAPVNIANWQPHNYEDTYRGPITLAKALAISSNSVAAQVGAEIGPQRIAGIAHRFGIKSPMRAYSSIALGASEVTLMEITGAYGVLANGGRQVRPHIVSEISTMRGDVLYSDPGGDMAQVFAEPAADLMTGMLTNVVSMGTGVGAQVPGWQIAGKTGTSQSWRDAWFVGYSSKLVGGVWLGNDDDKPTRKATGGGVAAGLFSRVMRIAHRDMTPAPLAGAQTAPIWMDIPFDDEITTFADDMSVSSDAIDAELDEIAAGLSEADTARREDGEAQAIRPPVIAEPPPTPARPMPEAPVEKAVEAAPVAPAPRLSALVTTPPEPAIDPVPKIAEQ